jgi:hypothetical protein
MGQLSDHNSRSIEPTSPSVERKVYAAPHLLEYGSVAKLTQTGSGGLVDFMSSKAMNTNTMRDSPRDAPAKKRSR